MNIHTQLPHIDLSDNETGCCPKFHPEDWDEKAFNFEQLKFIKTFTKSFMFMPLNMGKVMTKTMEDIVEAKADIKDQYFILSKDLTKWQAEHLFMVKSDVPAYESVQLQGTYYSKVFDGPFKDMPKWIKEMDAYMLRIGGPMNDCYAFYTTCPKCAKHYGHNYVVLFASGMFSN